MVSAARNRKSHWVNVVVSRVEIHREEVKVVFRVPPSPFVVSPSAGVLQHCGRRDIAAAGERLSPLRVRPVGPAVASEADHNRRRRGLGKPETFNFLGFTHICGKKRSNGWFTVLRQTMRTRLQAKLSEVKAELRRRMHRPIREQGAWLRSVVGGHVRYYGVP